MNSFPQRKAQRLPHWNYSSQSYYFVTLCTHGMKEIFGMPDCLSPMGKTVEKQILLIENRWERVKVDRFVIMPNHMHAIIVLGCDGNPDSLDQETSLSSVIGAFKSQVTREIHSFSPSYQVWQTSFYDSILKSPRDYEAASQYIADNPRNWMIGNKRDF